MAQQVRAPTSVGSTSGAVAASSGTVANSWALVNDYPDLSDPLTSYVQLGTTVNSLIIFGFPVFAVPAGATINYVEIQYTDEEASNGANTAAARLVVNGTSYNGATHNVNTATTNRAGTDGRWTTNPNTGAAWTVNDINGSGANPLQYFGVIGPDSNPAWRLGSIQIVVDYIDPPVAGTFASTLDAVTSNTQGQVRNVGTIAQTLAAVSAAFSGEVAIVPVAGFRSFLWLEGGGAADTGSPGTFASTLEGVAAALSGSITDVGLFASTLADITPAISGGVTGVMGYRSFLWLEGGGAGDVVEPSGTVDVTLAGATSSAALTVNDRGTIAVTLAGVSASFSGIVGTSFAGYRSFLWIEGGGAAMVPAEPEIIEAFDDGIPVSYYADLGPYYRHEQEGIAVGSRDNTAVSGEIGVTLAGATMAASGLVVEESTGTIDATLAGATLAGSGAVGAPEGTIDVTLDGANLDITGAVTSLGPIEATLSVTMAASGQIVVPGLLESTLQGATLAASGVMAEHATGTFGSTLAGVLGSESLRRRLNALAIRIGIGI